MNEGAKKKKVCERKQTVFEKTEDNCVSEYEDWIAILRLDIKRICVKSLNYATEWGRDNVLHAFVFQCSLCISLQHHFTLVDLVYINYSVSLQRVFCHLQSFFSHCRPRTWPPSHPSFHISLWQRARKQRLPASVALLTPSSLYHFLSFCHRFFFLRQIQL